MEGLMLFTIFTLATWIYLERGVTVDAYVEYSEELVLLSYKYNGQKYMVGLPRTTNNADLIYGETISLKLRISR